jgi:hypothetical protein
MIKLSLSVTGLAIIAFSSAANAAIDKNLYAMQEHCRQQAKLYFDQTITDKIAHHIQNQQISTFSNHFSRRFHRCYISISDSLVPILTDNRVTIYEVVDISDNNTVATAIDPHSNGNLSICFVGDQKCQTLSEYRYLIGLYTTDNYVARPAGEDRRQGRPP